MKLRLDLQPDQQHAARSGYGETVVRPLLFSIGITSRAGRYGGTFAHKDIAFEFAGGVGADDK